MIEKYPSELLQNAVEAIGSLPGVGSRSALRLALHLLGQPKENVHHFTEAINRLTDEVQYCSDCMMISDSARCSICSDHTRDHNTICVVESVRDVMSIEATGQYRGVYHVLGGVISPMEGIGINQLRLQELFTRVETGEVNELILALPATVEGDTTNFFIYKNVKEKVQTITTIARGIGVGEELEYADEVTLGRSLVARMEFDKAYKK